jgi:anti-anti-sigma factor
VNAVIADMTATTFWDCSGIRVLMHAHHQAAAHNAELRVVIRSARVLRILAMTQVDYLLLIHPGLDEALAP